MVLKTLCLQCVEKSVVCANQAVSLDSIINISHVWPVASIREERGTKEGWGEERKHELRGNKTEPGKYVYVYMK